MVQRLPTRPRPARVIAATIAALTLALLAVLPALAGAPNGGPNGGAASSGAIGWTKLDDPSVTPRHAGAGTPITFEVTYRNVHGIAPAYVRVVVDGISHAMAGSGTGWKAGVRFRVRFALAQGSHHVVFRALDTEKFPDVRDAGSVTVGVAAGETVTDPVTPTSGRAADLPDAMAEVPLGDVDVIVRPVSSVSVPPAAVVFPAPSPAASAAWPLAGDPILSALGLGHGGRLHLMPAVVSSVGAVGTWMAFILFGKRRRDGAAPATDAVLEAAAGRGLGIVATSALAPDDPEALMPRWRRPSLIEARKTDPIRAPGPAQPKLAFGADAENADAGLERRLIRYAVAPLLDAPDELRGGRIGDLAAGDEVQLVERSGAYWLVDSPDGRRGWIHRTTLGERVGAPDWAADDDPRSAALSGGAETFSAGRAMAARLAAVERH